MIERKIASFKTDAGICNNISNRIDSFEEKYKEDVKGIDNKIDENYNKTNHEINTLKYNIEFIKECDEIRDNERREHYLVQIMNMKEKQRITEKLYKLSVITIAIFTVLIILSVLLTMSTIIKYSVLVDDYSQLSDQFDKISTNYTIISNELESIVNNKYVDNSD